MNSRICNEKVTVIIVSFHSNHIIENLINAVEKNIKIIVIENSLDNKLKENLEKKFGNIQEVIPKKIWVMVEELIWVYVWQKQNFHCILMLT